MQINAKTIIGQSIVQFIEKQGKSTKKDLAEYVDCSHPYIEQCLKPLVNAGLIVSTIGCNGGYELRDGVITSWDLISANDNKGWDLTGDAWDSLVAGFIELAKRNKIVG